MPRVYRAFLSSTASSSHHCPPDPRTPSLQVPLPSLDTKLSTLRQTLSELTHLPSNGFKLIYAGAIMKDDDASRASFLYPIRHPPALSPFAPLLIPSCFPIHSSLPCQPSCNLY